MADGTLLSHLCSICNTAQSKYRCPGCAAQTCSLPCYKRHQQWAQCSGKRDPTTYVKKSLLTTPAGIDHDFNFLTGIERTLERSEKAARESRLGRVSDSRANQRKREVQASHYKDAAVTVIHAPKGLSRQRENKTHRSSHKNKQIIWTVEWIHEDGTRFLTESQSIESIAALQPWGASSKKRKRLPEDHAAAKVLYSEDVSPLSIIKTNESQVKTEKEKGEVNLEIEAQEVNVKVKNEEPSIEAEEGGSSIKVEKESSGKMADEISSAPKPHWHPEQPSKREAHNEAEMRSALNAALSSTDEPESRLIPPQPRFFLSKARTSSSHHVLIPILPTALLGDCLRGRTVLEFPTIYVFPSTTSQLPEDFILEEEYLKQEGEDEKEFQDMLKTVSPEALRAIRGEEAQDQASKEVDSKTILDVLKQDLSLGV
ncbi:hypothetical protein BDV95DRAFT_90881 [Massariosphaeria phaeospora]|uniref:Box C/D snoRNA protein 1 n=1 Tax=Massariosphaeria phaeospora TaxID=100035 RepID=A0A7C8IBE1_9PLEO|nr:hypothetical protein BDV95DRAFT_90881 [Massariosphaeria phaeospora]